MGKLYRSDVPITPCKTESRTTFVDTPHGKIKKVVKVPARKTDKK